MARAAAVCYGILAYVLFLATILYAVGFVGGFAVPKTIDSGLPGPFFEAALVNAALLALFAVQHSLMARPAFKQVWARIVPSAIERSTFVVFSCLALIILFAFWKPMPEPALWAVENPTLAAVLTGLSLLGWALVVVSTFLISHFELFGLRQVALNWLGRPAEAPSFRTPLLYRRVRHPIYLGFLLAFWATPVMTAGHLLFALATTGYILLGIQLEERDLIRLFGDQYRAYREQVAMLIPGLSPAKVTETARPAPVRT
jgi:protein-S-isoprenylcysteine O-methyltransferase Ste14